MKVEQVKPPQSLKRYFWDVDFEKLDILKQRPFIATRIFESGDVDAVRWLFQYVPRRELEDTLSRSRGISPKSAHFWSLLLSIDEKNVACLKKSSQKLQSSHWVK